MIITQPDYDNLLKKKVLESRGWWYCETLSGYMRPHKTREEAIETFNEDYGNVGEEKKPGKLFLYRCHSGRGISNPLSEEHIRKTWNLATMNDDDEQSLEDFLDSAHNGDEWHNDADELICTDDRS